jgi:hypothetical protein
MEIQCDKLRLSTSLIPHAKIKANEIKILNKDGSDALKITKPNITIRLLPLLRGHAHFNTVEMSYISSNLKIKDKLYLGDYPIEIDAKNACVDVDRVKIKKSNVNISDNGNLQKIGMTDFYYKKNRNSFILNGEMSCESKNISSFAKLDILIPRNKNYKSSKLNIKADNFDISVFSELASKIISEDIKNIEGRVTVNSDSHSLKADLNGIKILCKNPYNSIVFPQKFVILSDYKILKDKLILDKCNLSADGINACLSGDIENIISTTPNVNLKVALKDIDLRKGALMLPSIKTEDINLQKLKQYPFYAKMSGDMNITGKLPTPDVKGFVKVTDGILIKPIQNAKKGADITIHFKGQKLGLDVVVSAGGNEVVYVTGDIDIYGEKYVNLIIKSSKSVDLATAERVVNPLHEILCFLIGPVPIMDITGAGNVDIKVVGTKKDPHIWGNFNFTRTNARFLDVHNMVLKNASGNLNFNNQNAHFINKTGTLNGQPMTIDGVCTLFGDLDFNVTAKNQKLANLIDILTTSPMLVSVKSLVPPVRDVKGQADFILNLKGKVLDIEDVKINENVFLKGYIKLLGNSLNLNGMKANNIKGIINFNRKNCDFDIDSNISKSSRAKLVGKIIDNVADITVSAPRICVNEIEPERLKYVDNLYVKCYAKYKGKADKIEIGGINSVIEVIKDNLPVKHGKILSGKITLKGSNLSIQNLNGIIEKNPFKLNLTAKNLGHSELNLSKANFNGEFNCKEFDLAILNEITRMKILPSNLQNEIEKINVIGGNANINAKVRNNQLNSILDMNDIKFDYSTTIGSKKDKVTIPIKLISGRIILKNNTLMLNKLNCLIDNMPVLMYGAVNNIYKNPEYNIHINSKLVQKVIYKYWNAHNIYPIKMNGDILLTSQLMGNKNHTHLKTDIMMESNSSIYYMGATVGEALNPNTVNIDADIDKTGKVKLNRFSYNKLVSSQNNHQNVIPLLLMNGEVKKVGNIYAFKNFIVKTENPANANFFNIIFKKPTIKRGSFTSDLRINGTSNQPKIIGKFDVTNMEMPYLNTTIKDLDMEFKPDNIIVTTKGEILSNYIMVNAKIKNRLIPPYVVNGANLYVNELDVNHSIGQLKQLELKGLSSAISSDTDAVGADLLNSVILNDVKIRAGNVVIKNIKASNLDAICSLDDKMHLSVESFKFNMASGAISGKLHYNLLNNFMKLEMDAKDVNANSLTIALFDLPNQIYGLLTGHVELSCNATNDKTRMETLNGTADFKVAKGRMPKLGSLEYLLKAGNLIKGGITSLSMNGIIDVITPMKSGEFSSINGYLKIKDGVAKTLQIHSHGKDMNLYITGRYTFPTQIADMKVFGQISRKMSTLLGTAGNISLNTLFNKIPWISLDKNSQFISDLNKIPGIELTNKSTRKFMVEILGDINGDSYVKSFRWIN